MEKDLKNFYEKKITPKEFQDKIEKEYFYVLCRYVLFNGLKEAIYIFDRNQTSTYIFSKFSNIQKEEIKQIKKKLFEVLLSFAAGSFISYAAGSISFGFSVSFAIEMGDRNLKNKIKEMLE